MSLRTDVYEQLKDRLLAGELRTGQFVSQRELADLLGATLNPVREAIRKLEAEGLINVYDLPCARTSASWKPRASAR